MKTLCALLFLGLSLSLEAYGQVKEKPISKNYYDAVDFLVRRLRQKLSGSVKRNEQLNEKAPIISFGISEDLAYNIRDYTLQQLEGVNYRRRKFAFSQCKECMVVRAKVVNGEVHVQKGVNSDADLENLLQNLGAKTYAEGMLVTSKPFLKLLVNIYSAETKAVLWKGEVRIRSPKKSVFITHSLIGYGYTENAISNPILLSTFIGEKMFNVGEVGFESTLGIFYQPDSSGQSFEPTSFGVVLGFGAKLYYNVYRLMGINDGFITPHFFGGLKLELSYDSKDNSQFLNQGYSFEGGIAFLVGRFTWVEVNYSSTFDVAILAGFYF